MSESILALLLLPDPPQRHAHLSDIRAALYPPLDAAIACLKKESTPSVLEVALPISRLVHTFKKHRSLFANVGTLLANIYSLLASIYQQHNLLLSSTAPVDTRVLLVTDEPQPMPCGTVQFSTLARCHRQWTHVFVVDGENGLARYRNFKLLVERERPEWNPKMLRIPGGLQIYFPNELFSTEGNLDTLVEGPLKKDTLIAINPSTFDFTDKYTLTMGLFAVDSSPSRMATDILAEGMTDGRKIYVATVEGETATPADIQIEQQKRVIDFLLALMDFGEPKMLATYASKADMLDASFPLSSIEQKFRIQCFVSTQRHSNINNNTSVTAIVVASRSVSVAEDINEIRRARGWEALEVVKLENISATELAEKLTD